MADDDDQKNGSKGGPKGETERSPYLRTVSEASRASARHSSPSAERNSQPIIEVLAAHLPRTGRALEIASGTGQHAAAFAGAFPGIAWQPSDPDPAAGASIEAWRAWSGAANIAPPLAIDVMRAGWEDGLAPGFDAVIAINLLHISPWAATEGLVRGAGRLLAPEGLLAVYGCFMRDGAHISQSNIDFDASLRRHDPEWGVRDMGEVAREAERHGLRLIEAVAMPANNFTPIFRRG